MTNSEMLEFNTTTLHLWMKENDLESIVIDYSGGGDSGEMNGVSDEDGNEISGAKLLCMVQMNSECLNANMEIFPPNNNEVVIEVGKLMNTCSQLWAVALTGTGHNGFGNDDGGQGTLTINQDMSAVLRHEDNYYDETDIEDFSSSAFDENIAIDNILEHIKSEYENSFSIDFSWYGELEFDEYPSAEIDEEIEELVNFAFQNLDEDITNINGTITVNLDGTFTVEARGEIMKTENSYHEFEYSYDKNYIDNVIEAKKRPRASF